MSITLFGSCRIDKIISNHNNLNNIITYTHSTKEVIQLINFLTRKINIPPVFDILCFRTAIKENKPITFNLDINKLFIDSKLCIVEICSSKLYVYNKIYLHHICVDKRFSHYNINTSKEILDNYIMIQQADDEIENDILEIKKLIKPRKLVLITHYNSKMNGEYIPSRHNLINCLTNIALMHNIPLVNPTVVLRDYKQEDVMQSTLGHYTELGINKLSEYMNEYIKTIY